MTFLEECLKKIDVPCEKARMAAYGRWNSLAKPLGGLGLLEDAVANIAALTGSVDVMLVSRALVVLCADNGVVSQGVSQSGSDVTTIVTKALAEKNSTVCHMARVAGCHVLPVDMGVLDFPGAEDVLDRRIMNGTNNITYGPAMSQEACIQAVEVGIKLVRDLQNEHVSIIATGEMGIGNTTTSSAVASVLLGEKPIKVTGRGAGLSNEGLARKIAAIETAIAINNPDPNDPLDVLAKVGGLDIAGLCGIFLGGARYQVPIVIDGFISAVAALCAMRLCPEARGAMLASHVSAEPAGQMVLDELGLKPIITAGMHLGEGTGAVAALPLLDMALAVYNSGNTFINAGIEAYTPQ